MSVAAALLAVIATILLAGCEVGRPELLPVPSPDTSSFEKSVQKALGSARAGLDRTAAGRASNAELAEAYGELAMTYQAHSLLPAAEAAYQDAQRLAPRDKRWPYLLGHVYKDSARNAQAIPAFEAALAIDPADAAALHSLGKTALQQGQLDKAQQAFERLRKTDATRAAALAGLGKVAMARRDATTAIAMFEEALRLAPAATKLRHPLAMAYRDAGDQPKSDAALRGYSPQGPEPGVPDPLVDTVADKSATASALVRRGQRHGQQGRFDLAAEAFEAAAESNPDDAPTLANLGISLANLGQPEKAERALRRSIDIDPSSALAQLSLGLVHDRQGRDAEAAAHYEAVLRVEPAHVDARVYLADARMRMGNADEAARLYRAAMAQRPSPRVRLSLAFALVRAGQWREARTELEKGLAENARHAGMANALVRILAAAPDGHVRDGQRALQIGRPLFDATRSPDVVESVAMALAEAGQFERAVELQQQALAELERINPRDARTFAERNLELFRRREPSREPWPADDPAFQPRSPAASQRRPRSVRSSKRVGVRR